MRRPDRLAISTGDPLFLGELPDGFQHREPGSRRRPVDDQQRLGDQRVEQGDRGIGVHGTGYGTAALVVEYAGEHRTAGQQGLFRTGEQVI
ncbi:hypothetical protein [Mycobacterium sp. URHB0021]|jgi:hypothetical protein